MLLPACSQQSESGAASSGAASATPTSRGGGRGGRNVVAAATDIGTVQLGSISDGVAVTGTLRPIETVEVRARLDGELEGVYVREGQQIAAGQLLARFEAMEATSTLVSAQAELASAQGQLTTATWNLEQTDELFKVGAIPERDLRAARQEVTNARARVAAAEALQKSAGLGERDTRVVAPFTGTVATKHVDVGEHITRGTALFTLVRTNVLELAVTVPERRASSVAVGQQVVVTADGQQLTGRVARISPVIDPASRTISVYVDINNTGNRLRGGSFATGNILARTINNTIVIPASSLRRNADGTRLFVYRVNSGTIEEVDVTTGVLDDRAGLAQITSGLEAGDRIVTGNLGILTNGAQIQILGDDQPGDQRS